MGFEIEFTREAVRDFNELKRSIQALLDEAIEQRLSFEPAKENRNRKPHLRTNAVPADWELRVGDYRVFYDVFEEDALVLIVNIGYKPSERLWISGREIVDRD